MTDKELFELNQRGFIPGPGESEPSFLRRLHAAQEVLLAPPPPFDRMEKVPEPHWDWVRHYLKEFYDFQPCSLAAYYSNNQLALWQGAASWVMEESPGPLCAVQLRKGFSKGRYLKIYSRDEMLAHEAVHAARCAFQEPAYEEFFAYSTSEVGWRRKLGPIVKSPREVFFLLIALGLGAFWGNFLPAAFLLAYGFVRLGRRHHRLKKAAQNLYGKVRDQKAARALLFRLTDREIDQLASNQTLQDDGSPRFRVIRQYMKNSFNPSGI